MKYVCELCGYEYDPSVGDPENGIPAGVEFDDLPEGWLCPLCGASKEDFEVQKEEEEPDEDDN